MSFFNFSINYLIKFVIILFIFTKKYLINFLTKNNFKDKNY